MNFYNFKSFYTPKILKPFIGVLDELEYKFSYINESFKIVRDHIEKNMFANVGEWRKNLDESHNPRLNIYIAINNVAYGHLQTGKYHIYIGVIAEFGAGKGLLELYDFTAKELLKMGHWSKQEYKEYNANLKEAIDSIG